MIRAELRGRREQARRLAWSVSERIAEATTPELGKWAPAFVMVSHQSDALMDFLYTWERSGLEEDLKAVEAASVVLVAAWKEADRLYRDSLTDVPEGVAHGIR